MIQEPLKEFGLSDKEVKIYLSLLELGISTAQEIADHSELNRSTTYIILDSLLQQGLVTLDKHSEVQKYSVTTPEMLLEKTEKTIKRFSKVQKDIESIIPELQSLSKNKKHKPKVLFYEGKEGVRNVHEDVLSSPKGTLLRSFSQPAIWENADDSYYIYLRNQRIKKGIHLRAIHPFTSASKNEFRNPTNDRLAEFAFLPADKYMFTSDLRIYQDKIALTSTKEEFGVIIEDKDIADTMKETFDLAWEEAKRLSKKL